MTNQTAQTITRDPKFSDVYYITNAAGETRTYIDFGQDAPPIVSPVTVCPGMTPAQMDQRAARLESDRANARRVYFDEIHAPGPATTR